MPEHKPITKLNDTAFTDGEVINYEGENYYRACNAFVRHKPDGSTTFCVKRVGHDSAKYSPHEDYDGFAIRYGGVGRLYPSTN